MDASDARTPPSRASAPKPSRLWLWVVAACALQVAAWTAWLVIASQHQVHEVPLETKDSKKSP